jgi:hypothetical protein
LLAYWQFNEGNGYTGSDSTNYGNDCSLGSKKKQVPTWIGSGFGQERTCSVWGTKVWVKTFDRYVYGQPTFNTYYLALGTTSSLLNVQLKIDDNDVGRGNTVTGVAWNYLGDTVVLDLSYQTTANQRVNVNGQINTNNYITLQSNLTITTQYFGSKLVFTVDNDDWSMVIVTKPRQGITSISLTLSQYEWQNTGLVGICGNFNGNANDDTSLANANNGMFITDLQFNIA